MADIKTQYIVFDDGKGRRRKEACQTGRISGEVIIIDLNQLLVYLLLGVISIFVILGGSIAESGLILHVVVASLAGISR